MSASTAEVRTPGRIRACDPADAPRICAIYNHYVRETVITFEEEPVADEEMARRIHDTTARLPWLVWEEDGAIAGYACATPWKSRSAYRYAVEGAVYLAPERVGHGLGARLYDALIRELRERKIHCIVAGIALPNAASIVLHEKLGFTPIGHFREVGWKHGRWVDVGYWELIL